MSETVRIDRQHDVIVIDFSGDAKNRDLSQSLESVLRIIREQDMKNIMIDARLQSSLASTIELYSFACGLAIQTRCLKHALVVATHSMCDMSFIENVAVNRGANMRSFSSTEDALSWLSQ